VTGRGWWNLKANSPLTIAFYNSDIQVLKTYGAAPYTSKLKGVEKELKELQQKINEKIGT
jgi:26S proteasome regulatory subunit T1